MLSKPDSPSATSCCRDVSNDAAVLDEPGTAAHRARPGILGDLSSRHAAAIYIGLDVVRRAALIVYPCAPASCGARNDGKTGYKEARSGNRRTVVAATRRGSPGGTERVNGRESIVVRDRGCRRRDGSAIESSRDGCGEVAKDVYHHMRIAARYVDTKIRAAAWESRNDRAIGHSFTRDKVENTG